MSQKKHIERGETHCVNSCIPEHLNHHIPRMREIYFSLFSVAEDYDINQLLKNRGADAILRLFFDKHNILGGFAIVGIQHIKSDDKTYAVFSAGIYSDLDYNIGKHLPRFAFKLSLKYKLKHPTHKLAYLGEVLSPAGYSLSARTFSKCYPHPFHKTPEYLDKVIAAIKVYRQYNTIPGKKFIATFPIKRKIKNPERLYHSKLMQECIFYRHYFKLNTHFDEGAALIMYIPLNLDNLFWGIFNNGKLYIKRLFDRLRQTAHE